MFLRKKKYLWNSALSISTSNQPIPALFHESYKNSCYRNNNNNNSGLKLPLNHTRDFGVKLKTNTIKYYIYSKKHTDIRYIGALGTWEYACKWQHRCLSPDALFVVRICNFQIECECAHIACRVTMTHRGAAAALNWQENKFTTMNIEKLKHKKDLFLIKNIKN